MCGGCYRVRQAEGRRRRDIDPLAMRALFGEKFSLCEIRDVMERDDMEKAHREGWLERVLEEAGDYDMPELIDPDEYEESMLDLVHSDEDDAGIPDRVGLGDDDGAMSILLESGTDGSSGELGGVPQEDSWSGSGVGHRQDTDETIVVSKGKVIIDRSHTNDKFTIFAEDTR